MTHHLPLAHRLRTLFCVIAASLVTIFAVSSGQAGEPGAAVELPATAEAPATADAPAHTAEERALALKEKGDTLFRARNYVDALATYEEAYAASPNPRVLYNKGRALQALGRFGDAYIAIKRFESEAPEALRAQVGGLSKLLEDLRQRVTTITVAVNVPGAQIKLGDKVLGSSPLSEPHLVNAGPAKLQVIKDGYFTVEREVSLQGGGSASFDVTLESKARFAKVLIDSKVAGTAVSVDGKLVGNVPTEVVILPGTHQVVATREGHTDTTRQIIVEAGQHRNVTVDPIAKQRAVYEKWWFWGGMGVVAAATAATIVLVSQDAEKSNGDFSPSIVSAPLTRF